MCGLLLRSWRKQTHAGGAVSVPLRRPSAIRTDSLRPPGIRPGALSILFYRNLHRRLKCAHPGEDHLQFHRVRCAADELKLLRKAPLGYVQNRAVRRHNLAAVAGAEGVDRMLLPVGGPVTARGNLIGDKVGFVIPLRRLTEKDDIGHGPPTCNRPQRHAVGQGGEGLPLGQIQRDVLPVPIQPGAPGDVDGQVLRPAEIAALQTEGGHAPPRPQCRWR